MNWARLCLLFASAIGLWAQAPTPHPPPANVAVTPGAPSITPPAPAFAPNTVVLTVGDEKITAAEFDQLIEALQIHGAKKREIATRLVEIKVMYQEAHKRKLDENPNVQRELEVQRESLLARVLLQDMTANVQVDDAAAEQYYDQHKADYETVHARHILIRVKGSSLPVQPGRKELSDEEALAKAQDIRKKLLAGEDFAALAKAESDDIQSGAKGGDLGAVRHHQTVPPFEEAVFSLPVGQLSEPIKTQFGYHIIKVEQHDVKPFAEVKADVIKKLRPELAHSAMEKLQKQATVVIDDAYFGPATTPPAPSAR